MKKTGRNCYLNGYGGHIDQISLDGYLENVKSLWDKKLLKGEKDFADVYSM